MKLKMKGKKLLSVLLAGAMLATTVFGAAAVTADEGEVQEITWMFWDDLDATTDNISLGYKDEERKDYDLAKLKYEKIHNEKY